MTLVCVPIMVEESDAALRDAALALEHGADLVEYRVDLLFEDRGDEDLETRVSRVLDLVKMSPATCIVTCRPHWEGGEYHGDDDERVALYEALGTSDHPPAYIDVELATYTRSANIRQKINLAVDHPKQQRPVTTRLILSAHDFEGRPPDLTRKIIAMNDEPACSIVKIAYRARSIRDNLELFEILRDRQKPTIALGMGAFGLMSRVLAPKFGGYLTFASLRDESTTAPGQPSLHDLLGLYRFRAITAQTKVYGIIGWPVTQSMSPLVHNAGFEQAGWDGVYLPMPIEQSYESFKATVLSLLDHSGLGFAGASVTIPHKEHANRLAQEPGADREFVLDKDAQQIGASNTISVISKRDAVTGEPRSWIDVQNTDASAILELCVSRFDPDAGSIGHGVVVGAGGAAKAAAKMLATIADRVTVVNRSTDRAHELVDTLTPANADPICELAALGLDRLGGLAADVYINCTPVGMTGGPDPEGLSIPIPDLPNLPRETVFFDTVYNPIQTPMLKAAKERGCRTIDGVEMFVKQAAAQFELWTGQTGVEQLFDTLVREKLTGPDAE